MRLDARPTRAPHPRRVDDPNSLARQGAGRGLGDTAADLLDHHRHAELAHQRADFRQQAGEVALSFGLDRLLEGIQVEDQGVGPDHRHRVPARLDAHAIVELDGAQIGQQDGRGSDLANAEGISFGGIFQCFALRADAHRDAGLLGRRGQVAVDLPRRLGAPGHTGDEEGRRQAPAEEAHPGVDGVEVDLRQRRVVEAVVVEIVSPELHALFEGEADVLQLAVALGRRDCGSQLGGLRHRIRGAGRRAHCSRSRR